MASHKNGVPTQTGEAAPTSSTVATLPPSTSGVQAPVQTAPPTVAAPIDLLGQLFKAMRPNLDVSQALAFITQAPVPVQPQTQPTTPAVQAIPLTIPSTTPATQPILETTPSSTHPTTTGETASVVEAAVDEEVGREEEVEGGQAAETTDQEKDPGREEEAEAELIGEAAEKGTDVAPADERMEDQVTDMTVDQPEKLGEMETGSIIEVPEGPAPAETTPEVVEVEDGDFQMITLQEALAIPVLTPPMGT